MLLATVNSAQRKNPKKAVTHTATNKLSTYGDKFPIVKTEHILSKIVAVIGCLELLVCPCIRLTAFSKAVILKHGELSVHINGHGMLLSGKQNEYHLSTT